MAENAPPSCSRMSVWLDIPLDVVIDRLPADGRRPLAADRADWSAVRPRQLASAQAHVGGRTGIMARIIAERILEALANGCALSDPVRHSRERRARDAVLAAARPFVGIARLSSGDLVCYGPSRTRRRRGSRSSRSLSFAATTTKRPRDSRRNNFNQVPGSRPTDAQTLTDANRQ